MLKNYLIVAFRNLRRDKMHSFINISGLGIGMAVVGLIGLWIYDECTFDRFNPQYDHIARLMQNESANGEISTTPSLPYPLVSELRTTYGGAFKRVVASWWTRDHVLAYGGKKLTQKGKFMEPGAAELMALHLEQGTGTALEDRASILLSASAAEALFGSADPLGQVLHIDNQMAAVAFMGLKDPIGTPVTWDDKHYTVIGVVKNMIIGSPYEPAYQTVYLLNHDFNHTWLFIRMRPGIPVGDALTAIRTAFLHVLPSATFDYHFVDDQYAQKFAAEQQVGTLAAGAAGFALFISALGIFGMAAFMAEQRIREIGVRRVLGATVFSIWQLLSREFVLLVALSLTIAAPLAGILMHRWLQNYTFHTGIAWWIFAATGAGTLAITLLTVSWTAVRAALANPVKSLRTE